MLCLSCCRPPYDLYSSKLIPLIPKRKVDDLLGSPLHKLLEILHCRNAQDKPPLLIRNDGKFLLPRSFGHTSAVKVFEFFEGGLHGNDLVGAALALETCHGG